jgi:hypothetical protein
MDFRGTSRNSGKNLAKFRKNLAKLWRSLFGALLQPPAPKKKSKNLTKISQIFDKKLRFENGAKECIV